MATSNIQYCTHRDIKDTFPRINEFDTKRTIYGWTLTSSGENFHDTSLDAWHTNNTGLITEMFYNGGKMDKITYSLTEATKLNGILYAGSVAMEVDSTSSLGTDDILKIDNEYFIVTSITDGDTLVMVGGQFGTTTANHANDASIYKVIDAIDDMTDAVSAGEVPQFMYDSDLDLAILIGTSNPNDNLIESGDDFATIMTRFAKRASRMIDSKIGYRVTDTQIKDREGNYPDIIVRAAALQSVILLLTSEDPTNPIIEPFKEELLEIVEGINAGTIVILGNQRTMDAAKGIIREVSVNSASDLRPVELTGNYTGSAYELLKVYIDSGENGVIGTTRMTVKGKDSTKLKNNVLIDSEIITGDYQSLGVSGMKIRWSGDNDAAITTADDEYEIELFGHNLDSSTPGQVGNIKMTRR